MLFSEQFSGERMNRLHDLNQAWAFSVHGTWFLVLEFKVQLKNTKPDMSHKN